MHFQNEGVFFFGPFSPYDRWVNHVVPSLTTLTSKSTRQEPRNDHPVLCSELINLGSKNFILFWCPLCATDLVLNSKVIFIHLRIVFKLRLIFLLTSLLNLLEIQPPLETSDLRLVWHELTKSMPGLITVYFNKSSEFFVL